jgi:hypothetical protein
LLASAKQGLRPLLLDFHGFSRPAPYGDFDVIMGTGNRRTVTNDTDTKLGEYLRGKGYSVFIPGLTTYIPGVDDYLDADHTVHAASRHGTDAVQIEVARRFREIGGEPLGRQLARHFAEFIASYSV